MLFRLCSEETELPIFKGKVVEAVDSGFRVHVLSCSMMPVFSKVAHIRSTGVRI